MHNSSKVYKKIHLIYVTRPEIIPNNVFFCYIDTNLFIFEKNLDEFQILYPTLDQSKSGSACHMTRSAIHRFHSVVI